MLIDWFTVAAQAVNFLILVWLLKRFLYAPILNAIDAREKRIADALANAVAMQAVADASITDYDKKYAELEAVRLVLLKQASDDAAIERQRLITIALSDANILRNKQQEQLRNEYRQQGDEITRRIRAEVFFIAKKILLDLAGESLEARMVAVFIERLGKLDFEAQQQLSSATQVLVYSAFEQTERSIIEAAIRKLTPAVISFEVVPHLINGIVLVAQGHKVTWSVADYLSTLENEVNALIKIQSNVELNGHGNDAIPDDAKECLSKFDVK